MSNARGRFAFRKLTRAGLGLGLAAGAMLLASSPSENAIANGDTRTLSMHHVHTGESITITYKRDGEYVPAALKKLNWFLRDWRKGEETRMDPRLFDILWQVYRDTGANKPIEIICGFRAPGTNKLLRARSRGVARFSQHILGKAIDYFIPGVNLAKLRAVGLKLQRGGVGFYPHSGSPFVHMDVGSVRHWPGISRQQLVRIFPHGRTVHVPSDGRPLSGYAEALAEIERHGNVPNARSLKAARVAGLITVREERVAELVGQGRLQKLASLVTSGRDNGQAKGHAKAAAPVVASLTSIKKTPKAEPVQVASAGPVPMPHARPQRLMVLASARAKTAAQPIVTASAENLFEMRGYWRRPIDGNPPESSPFNIAGIDSSMTGTTGDAPLAYASTATTRTASVARRRPMATHVNARLPRIVGPPMADTLSQPILATAESLLGSPMAIGGQRLDSPWTRAAMLTPSVAEAMLVTRLSENDPRLLRDLLYKPTRSLVMTFSGDPQHGMSTDRFTGNAVVFLATASFVPQRTASLP